MIDCNSNDAAFVFWYAAGERYAFMKRFYPMAKREKAAFI
jgi:hypothetical protein